MFNKILAITLVFLSLSSCAPTGEHLDPNRISATVSQPFTTGAVVKYKDIEANANIIKGEESGYEITFSSPESLNGISFRFVNSKIIVGYEDMNFELDTQSTAGSAIASMVLEAINTAAADVGVEISLEDSAIIISGDTSSGKFHLALDEKNGNFLSLEIPEEELSMVFNNFVIS